MYVCVAKSRGLQYWRNPNNKPISNKK